MKLSIIIPVYKVEKYVEKCLRSCAEQDISSDEYEIIVVNDGSPDKSLEIVERVAKEYNNIHVVSQENQGVSLARNKGLSLAKGDYIWFVDSDDWIEKNVLKELITQCIVKDLDILHFCRTFVIKEKDMRHCIKYKSREKSIIKGKDALLLKYYSPNIYTSIYRKNFLSENNLSFDPEISFGEDMEFNCRVWYMAQRVMFINNICYYYFINSNSIIHTDNPKKSFDLIKICKDLHKFSQTVENKYKIFFHNKISEGITISLSNSFIMNSIDIRELNIAWKKHSYLFEHLKMSNKLRYKCRYYLFQIFSPHYCQINNAFHYPYRIIFYFTHPKLGFDFLKRQKSRIVTRYLKNKSQKNGKDLQYSNKK